MKAKINLDQLTQAHVDEAMVNFGVGCNYAAPCIIGTLVHPDKREIFDNICNHPDDETISIDDSTVDTLSMHGLFEFPNIDQQREAGEMQCAFDSGNVVQLRILLEKRGLVLKEELTPVRPAFTWL